MKKKIRFSKKRRLSERAQFVRLFDQPTVIKFPEFMAFLKNNSDQGRVCGPRLGITIKGKLTSVWRNRIKRVIREWFRCRAGHIGPFDINVVPRLPVTLSLVYVERLRARLESWKML